MISRNLTIKQNTATRRERLTDYNISPLHEITYKKKSVRQTKLMKKRKEEK